MIISIQKSQNIKELHEFVEYLVVEEKVECVQSLSQSDKEHLTLLLIKTLDDPVEWFVNHSDLQVIMFKALHATNKDEIYQLSQSIKDAAINYFSEFLDEMIQIQVNNFCSKKSYDKKYEIGASI